MDALECRDCGLGLKFSTKEELQNHQKKFCANSHYNDPQKMDVRLAGLRRQNDDQIANLPMGDIRDYIQGKNPQNYNSNQPMNGNTPFNDPYGLSLPKPARDWQNDPTMTELEKQAMELKDNRMQQRANRELTETHMMDLLKDLQHRKEHELRAQIEKEEIARAIKSSNPGADPANLGNLERVRKNELQKLASEREALRIKEQNLFEEVGKMEADLMKGQQNYAGGAESRNDFNVHYETEQGRRNDELNSKQNEFAQQRATQVARIKLEREKLEHDRQRIMRDLTDLNQKKQAAGGQRVNSRGSYRSNAAAQRAGSMLAGNKPPSAYSNQREGGGLEPSLKDKIVRDQMRLNKLKEDSRSMPQLPPEYDSLAAMQRERRQQQDPYDKIHMMADEFANKNIPNKGEMLGDIRRQLESDETHPYSVPKHASSKAPPEGYSDHQENTPGHRQKINDDKLVSMLNNLEGIVVGAQHQTPGKRAPKSGRPPLIPTQQAFQPVYNSMPAQQAVPWQIPQMQMQPAMQMQMQPPMPIQPQDQFAYQQQPAYPPPAQPQYDPAMAQIASLLKNQDEENKKLRDVLENFGKNAPTVEQLDHQIMGTNQQLLALRKDPSAVDPRIGADPMNPYPKPDNQVPDDFMFRQNEERNADLETEERAIMNLQAQEFDQLRLIEKLPKDSELYKFKMQQFKELSVMRAESEKLLQQQRLQKLQRDFNRQAKEDDRADQHQQWLEQQKRQILEAKMGIQPQPLSRHSGQRSNLQPAIRSQVNFNQPMSQSNLMPPVLSDHIGIQEQNAGGPRLSVNDRVQNSSPVVQEPSQFLVQFDYAHLLPRQVRQLKIVASIFRGEQLLGDPQQAGPVDAEADPNSKNHNKVYFAKKTLFMLPEKRTADTRVIFELQAVDPGQVTGFTGLGWTWINLFQDRNLDQLRGGLWSLPVYAGPTKPAVAQNKMKRPGFAPGVTLAIRIGHPGENVFRSRPLTHINLEESPIPKEHEGAAAQILRLQGQPGPAATGKFPEPPRRESEPKSPRRDDRVQNDLRREIVKKGPDPNFHSSGIKLKVHYTQNLRPLKKLTLRLTVQQGQKGPISVGGKECVYKSPSGQEAPVVEVKAGDVIGIGRDGELVIEDVTQLRKSPTTNYLEANITDTVVRPIDNFDIKLERDLHDLYWTYDGDDMIYLVVEVYAETAQQQSRKRVSWALFELVNAEDGKINYGFHNIPLLMPPMTFKKSEQQVLEGESVGFTITDLDDVKQASVSERRSEKSVPISEQFLPNFESQNTLSGGWLDTDALDIYIDGARHLPDNVTLTKVTAKVIDVDLKQVGVGQFGTVLLNTSTLRNQNFGMKLELRSDKRIPPTSLLFLTLQTVDNSKINPCVIGYSYFPLFFNVDEQMPAMSNGDRKVSALTGCYQMPIFYAKPKEEKPFNYEKFIYLERVPTASVLLRVVKAPKNQQTGLAIRAADLAPEEQQRAYLKAPQYSEGVYGTQYYSITEDERKIMTLRRLRPNPPIPQVAQMLGQAMRMDMNEVVNYIQKLEHTANTPQIDLTYYSQYEPGLGIRVNIEAIHDNKIEGFFGVLASVTPPASYYDEQRQEESQDTFVFTEPDYDGHNRTFKFSEGDALVMGFTPTQPGMSLFFEISVWLPKKNQFEPYGFTLVPLVETLETDADESTHEYYVSSGVFSLPVYKGPVDKGIIQQLKSSTDPLGVLRSLKQKNAIQLLGNTSLIVRIVDTQRKMHFLRSFEQQAPSLKYLETAQQSTHKFKPITGGLLGGPKKLRELIPSQYKGKEQKFTEFIEEAFIKHVGL